MEFPVGTLKLHLSLTPQVMGVVPHPRCLMRVRDGCASWVWEGAGWRGAAHLGTVLVLASSMAHTSSNEVDLPSVGSHPEGASLVAGLVQTPVVAK